MPKKHLVLDYDVHAKLGKRKRQTGIPLRNIGNVILRSVLSAAPAVSDVVVDRLKQMGRLSEEEHVDLARAAAHELSAAATTGDCAMNWVSETDRIAGSWLIRRIGQTEDMSCEVLHAVARDRRGRPILPHTHEADEWILVVEGSVLVCIAGQHILLGPSESACIPAGEIHDATALSGETRALVVFFVSPAKQHLGG